MSIVLVLNRKTRPIIKKIMAAASHGFHMFQAHTENLCLQLWNPSGGGGERNYSTCVSDIKRRLVNYNPILTYVMATGSDEIISRIFSQPSAVM